MPVNNKKLDWKGVGFVTMVVFVGLILYFFYDKQYVIKILKSDVTTLIVVSYVLFGYIVEIFYVNPPKSLNFDFDAIKDFFINIFTYIAVTSSAYALFKYGILQLLSAEVYFNQFDKLDLAAVMIVSFVLLIKYLSEATGYYKEAIYNSNYADTESA